MASMRRIAALALGLLALPAAAHAQADSLPLAVLRPGMVITRSARITPGTYRIPMTDANNTAAIVVRGDGIRLDLTGVVLEGTDPSADPDQAEGIGILVDGGSNVEIRGARIRGYRTAILARLTRDLRLLANTVSYNWKPRLFSLPEHESLVDWLSYHHDENGEWHRFGAAIALVDVTGGLLRGNIAEQGMNGLMLTRSDSLEIRDNTFRFNSGLGIGMYRSSGNLIAGNRLDYNVRGYSHGFFRRGQDSAGLLMFEQSSHNVVVANSVTHGGDGLFLWAGQTTMDTGEGGSNDNLFLGNDFSYAPTNGMEATFSRNAFAGNVIRGSDHGLWGGYSWNSTVEANCFAGNRIGVAIEHGQDINISGNRFMGDGTAISLWANPVEPGDWEYPKRRDTRSRGYWITGNRFTSLKAGLRIGATSDLHITDNAWSGVDSVLVLRDTAVRIAMQDTAGAHQSPGSAPLLCPDRPTVPATWQGMIQLGSDTAEFPAGEVAARPRRAIIVDEWGPYDWRSPKLWPVDSTRAVPLQLAVLGPPGTWQVMTERGIASVSSRSGRTGDTIRVTPDTRAGTDWELVLEYRGEATLSPRGDWQAAGEPYRFSYRRFEPAARWKVRYFRWEDSAAARRAPDEVVFRAAPILDHQESRLDYMWYRPTIPGVPADHWALEARARLVLPGGTWTIRTISDDAVRVWVDGVLVIDNWSPHESEVDHAPLTGGRHDVRVRYAQVDGWTELRLDVVRGSETSRGSPGPH